MSYYIVSDELYHHGILGQKWGVRRYQNPDGSLTATGKARYAKDERKALLNAFYRNLDTKDKIAAVKKTDTYKEALAAMDKSTESKQEFLKKYKGQVDAELEYRFNKNYVKGARAASKVLNSSDPKLSSRKWKELVDLEDAVTRLAIEESFGELYSLYNEKG